MLTVHVIPTLCNGGIERFLMNFISASSDDMHNDVVVYDKRNYWKVEMEKRGVGVTAIDPPSKTGIFRNMNILYKYFKQRKPDAVYAYTYYNAAYVLLAALFAGVKIRIIHVHTSATDHPKTVSYKIYVFLSKILLSIMPIKRLACSYESGKTIFYRRFTVIENGIELKDYIYDSRSRLTLRKKLGVDSNTIVIGMVGWLNKNKNQEFMLNVLSEYYKKNKNVRLVIVGEGPEEKNLKKLANDLHIKNKVIFMGNIRDIAKYYNMFDVFALPSINEAFPFVLIEAQANGLPIVASSTVSRETKINRNFEFIDLNLGARYWADLIDNMPKYRIKPNSRIMSYSIDAMFEKIKAVYKGDKIC